LIIEPRCRRGGGEEERAAGISSWEGAALDDPTYLRPSPARARRRPTTPLASLDPRAPPEVTCCPRPRPPRRKPEPPRRPPPAAVDPPRPAALRPNSNHQSTLGEPLAEPSRLPGRDRRRLAGIWPEPRRPPAKDPIAGFEFLVGCFV
jgi:hypothetical protein